MLFQPLLSQAMLSHAMLSQAILSQAMLSQAILSQAMLSQAMLSHAGSFQGSVSQVKGSQLVPKYVRFFQTSGWPYATEYSARAAPSASRCPWLAEPRLGLLVVASASNNYVPAPAGKPD